MLTSRCYALAILFLCLVPTSAFAADCDAATVTGVLSASTDPVIINCKLVLDLTPKFDSRGNRVSVISKRLRFVGSGASGSRLRCHGAQLTSKISVESRAVANGSGLVKDGLGYQVWDRPSDVTIDNCRINGYVHVRTGPDYSAPDWVSLEEYASSRDTRPNHNHVERLRANAPTAVRIVNRSVITTTGTAAVYIYPGVTYFELRDSSIRGYEGDDPEKIPAIAMYLDAESHGALIKGNDFSFKASRELVAIDTSDYNRIIDNRFEALGDHGGVYVFRNCGECHDPLAQYVVEANGSTRKVCRVGTGKVRHTQPSHNEIVNNVFTTGGVNGERERGVWLGSQGGAATYCDADSDVDTGSGASDLDHAHHNIVMQNQIIVRSVSSSITDDGWPNAYDNVVSRNESTDRTIQREAGCYLRTGFATNFLLSGSEPVPVLDGPYPSTCLLKGCTDGIRSDVGSCVMRKVDFYVYTLNNNAGVAKIVKCPTGTTIMGMTAACDLETEAAAAVSYTQLSEVDPGKLDVVRKSNIISDGGCAAANTRQSQGDAQILGSAGLRDTSVGCFEADPNGGDCTIRGALYCR